jgi:hypothetical protein
MTKTACEDDRHYLLIDGKELRFEQVGKFRAGAQETEVPLGRRLVAIMPTLRVGWVKWRPDLEWEWPTEMHWGLVADGYKAPSRKSLGDNTPAGWRYPDRDPWQRLHTLLLVDFKNREKFAFIASTDDEVTAVARLAYIYGRMIRNDKRLLPIVALRTRSEKRGMVRIHRPFFEVVDWTRPPDGRSRRKSPSPPNTDAPLQILNLE